jgi:hypothetical protein
LRQIESLSLSSHQILLSFFNETGADTGRHQVSQPHDVIQLAYPKTVANEGDLDDKARRQMQGLNEFYGQCMKINPSLRPGLGSG